MLLHIVTDTYAPDANGVAQSLSQLVAFLHDRGHQVLVLRAGKARTDIEEELASIPFLPSALSLGVPQKRKFLRKWALARPDLVYIPSGSPLGLSAARAASELGIPLLCDFPRHPGLEEETRLPGKKELRYLKKFHDRAGLTLLRSAALKEALEAEGFSRTTVWTPGVDHDLFSPLKRDYSLRADWGARRDSLLVGLSGKVGEEKNLPFALSLLSRLKEQGHDLIPVVMGDGELRVYLEARYPQANFTGTLTGEALAKAYASLDILLIPSVAATSGNTLREALASGLATISMPNEPAVELIEHEINGFLSDGVTEEEFESAVKQALSRAGKDSVLRQKARQGILESSWENRGEDWLTLAERTRENGAMRAAAPARVKSSAYSRESLKGGELRCETIFLSDIHLGTSDSKAREAVRLLKKTVCRKIVLNGDIIDAWALKRGGSWTHPHTRFIRTLLKKMEKENCEVIYVRGNHDDIVERFAPLFLGNLKIVKEHIHEGLNGKRYLVTHGDGFDTISTNHKWVAVAGSIGYDFLLAFNRYYNLWRSWRGKEYYSLSKSVKNKVKSAVSFIGRYEDQLLCLAGHRKCDGIICGHIHHPADKKIEGVHYLNCGDWVETMSFVMEGTDGEFSTHLYSDLGGLLTPCEKDVN